MSELRALIREVLREELGHLRGGGGVAATPQVREEKVAIANDADLAGFVRRIATLLQDPRSRADIEAGRHVFRLGAGGAVPLQAHMPSVPQTAPQAVRFERGLVSERDVAALADGQQRISVGKTVRFTPLAADELRRRGIKIERAKS